MIVLESVVVSVKIEVKVGFDCIVILLDDFDVFICDLN